MRKVLSVVIPSFNTEKFIDKCLSSMLAVSNREKIEILLVNDGSSDCTKDIAELYENRFPEIVRVINKSNGGHGSCINKGIEEAKGEYFKVIDGDDWVEKKGFEKLIHLLEESSEDVVVNSVIEKNVSTGKTRERFYKNSGRIMDLIEYLDSNLGEINLPAMTIKTAILQNNNIRVREKCFYEDTEYIIYPIQYVHTIRSYDFPVYVYRVGQSTQSINPEKAFKNRNHLHMIVDDCITYFNIYVSDASEIKRDYIANIIASRIVTMYNNFFKVKFNSSIIDEIIEWDQELKNKSMFFYQKSNIFPISFLRGNIKKRSYFTYLMYRAFFMMRKG